jgi:hypothetical protein
MISLFYCARPVYGGWVSFTAHLALKYNLPLFEIGNKTEYTKEGLPKLRDYGYGVTYQNIAIADLEKIKGKILITAIDKTNYEFLDKFPDGTFIVIHDPTEVKSKAAEPLLKHLPRFTILTIRESVKTYLKNTYNLKSKFIIHPFFEYPFEKTSNPTKAVSISRVDFDKHTDIILEANKDLDSPIEIYGAINRQYVFFGLKDYPFKKYYKGTFEKSFQELSDLLKNVKFVVDMSVIKNDGGGSQYTFLEAIYQECALIINKKWIEGFETPFKDQKNCFVVADGPELAKRLETNPKVDSIIKEAKKILKPHLEVDWPKEMARL